MAARPIRLLRPRAPALAAMLLAGGATLLQSDHAAQALERGTTAQQRAYVSGGVGAQEQAELEAMQRRFTLWVLTVDARSGAWLSDAAVELRAADGAVVLATQMAGPYLLVDLAPGRYQLIVTVAGQTRAQPVHVAAGGVRRVVLRFDTGADVLPAPVERDRTSMAAVRRGARENT